MSRGRTGTSGSGTPTPSPRRHRRAGGLPDDPGDPRQPDRRRPARWAARFRCASRRAPAVPAGPRRVRARVRPRWTRSRRWTGRRFEIRPAVARGRDPRSTGVVFIGRDPDRDRLTEGLRGCAV
ncbi:GTP-binding protein [Saccharopolyspora rosea]|uniref:GTP-binding protein n=1 Tax=Saccharopolyspora rosea TaxID=524884 RepID=A0ABW3FPT8_9PSEU